MQWVRLVSALAEMHSGRAYLYTAVSAVVQQLCYYLQAEEGLSKSNVSQWGPIHAFSVCGCAVTAVMWAWAYLSLRTYAVNERRHDPKPGG